MGVSPQPVSPRRQAQLLQQAGGGLAAAAHLLKLGSDPQHGI